MLADFLRVILLGLDAFGIAHNALGIRNTKLGGHVSNDSHGNIHWIGEKGSQESESANLHPKAEPIVIPTALGNEGAIRIIQMKIASKLLSCRFANIAAIALLLFLGQVINRHPAFLVFLSIKQSFSF